MTVYETDVPGVGKKFEVEIGGDECRTGRLGSVLPAFAVGYVLAMRIVGSLLVGRADSITNFFEPNP